ncbi:predicted protein [Histoplasma mississippiense (nom. inval.)]|uniref:predicted protein n=1 Tax=Ajellomyces capsulatus (strain NAm1 / WU24) TaxID=2059318 RepID=UPI000157D590|nr:predicted protein [Histoplasma mississippiense (nom. inval.)]EDN05039.1 predicted protein [Histoplasma mississippiense (nom. inval.)]
MPNREASKRARRNLKGTMAVPLLRCPPACPGERAGIRRRLIRLLGLQRSRHFLEFNLIWRMWTWDECKAFSAVGLKLVGET